MESKYDIGLAVNGLNTTVAESHKILDQIVSDQIGEGVQEQAGWGLVRRLEWLRDFLK